VRWNWRKTVKVIEDQKVKEIRPKAKVDEYLIYKGKHDGIVSEELFKRAQEIKGTRHRATDTNTLRNAFSGIMYCKCGAKMGYNTYRRKGVEYAPPKLVCNDQIHCKSGSVVFDEIYRDVCSTIKDCIQDFQLRIENNQDDSFKLHKDLVNRLEKKLKELEEKEIKQWEDQYNPDVAMPQEIFKKLNQKLLAEKEEIQKALAKAKGSIPKQIDYREEMMKFEDALDALEDPEVDAKVKNQFLKNIIDRIEYTRSSTVRITKHNAEHYGIDAGKGVKWYTPPYSIKMKLKYK
jgi:site-specific DNA recombinase